MKNTIALLPITILTLIICHVQSAEIRGLMYHKQTDFRKFLEPKQLNELESTVYKLINENPAVPDIIKKEWERLTKQNRKESGKTFANGFIFRQSEESKFDTDGKWVPRDKEGSYIFARRGSKTFTKNKKEIEEEKNCQASCEFAEKGRCWLQNIEQLEYASQNIHLRLSVTYNYWEKEYPEIRLVLAFPDLKINYTGKRGKNGKAAIALLFESWEGGNFKTAERRLGFTMISWEEERGNSQFIDPKEEIYGFQSDELKPEDLREWFRFVNQASFSAYHEALLRTLAYNLKLLTEKHQFKMGEAEFSTDTCTFIKQETVQTIKPEYILDW